MKRALALLTSVSIMLSVNLSFSQESQNSNINKINLYINSDPLKAEVIINGELMGKTPIRITISEFKELNVQIHKQGYVPLKETIKLKGERKEVFFFRLFPLTMSLVFPQQGEELYIDSIPSGKTPLIIKNLPDGTYEMKKNLEGIFISRAKQRELVRNSLVEALFCAGLGGVSFYGKEYYEERRKQIESHTLGFSSFIFGLLTGYNLFKMYKAILKNREGEKSFHTIKVEPYRAEEAKEYFTKGMEFLGRKEWEKAGTRFNLVITLFSESEFVPVSMYELGYCNYKLGKLSEAGEILKRFLSEYPVFEFFPYALYYLLLTRMEQGEALQAIQDYQSVRPVFLEDPGGDLQRDFFDLFIRLYEKTGSKNRYILEDLLLELDYFLQQNPDSPAYSRIYFMKGTLLFRYLDREKGLEVFSDIEEKYIDDKELISEMEKLIHG